MNSTKKPCQGSNDARRGTSDMDLGPAGHGGVGWLAFHARLPRLSVRVVPDRRTEPSGGKSVLHDSGKLQE